MKRISDKKLEAFTVGAMGNRQLSKKEKEEQKKKEDEAAAANVFKEFVETFQDTPAPSWKVWVKSGTYDAGSGREDNREKGKLYKPTSKLDDKSAAEKAQDYAKMLASDVKKESLLLKKKTQEKKKSNLELFKEELRQIQEEREERHKYKHLGSSSAPPPQQQQQAASSDTSTDGRGGGSGSFDTGDPNTTNLYLGNLSPKISEQELMEIFGRYGPLASIKIMWPRSEEEKQRGRNCGFVAYMSRKDAERALNTLGGRYIMGYEMRLGWGKSMPIMNQPIYIPPPMLELTIPPPPSGLPFNAQPPPSEVDNVPKGNYKEYTTPEEKEAMERILPKSVVKVFIPTEKTVLYIIHRMIEFVIREGPLFEALIMSHEIGNPLYAFLFENESPAHIYYRWKLFSLLQGDTPTEWSEKEFRMFKNGPIWKPPNSNFYTQGMPEELVVDPDAPEVHKGALSTAQRDRLEYLIRHLTPERARIGDAMIFCIEHADAADEICECISESLANSNTLASKKIARLYLISDILHNCAVKVSNASFFRKAIERHLQEIFENLHAFFMSIESRLKAEGFKSRVMNVIKAWEEWAVYSKDFLAKLKSTFLGKQLIITEEPKMEETDIDGAPLSGDDKDDEDLDGVPLDGAALLKSALLRSMPEALKKNTPTRREINDYRDDEDLDGVPLDDDIDGIPLEKVTTDKNLRGAAAAGGGGGGGAFIPSKWETVDPNQVEAQAITTSKWDTLEQAQKSKFQAHTSDVEEENYNEYDDDDNEVDDDDDDDDNEQNAHKYDEDARSRLREIEVKTMHYQDELESGRRELKSGWSIGEQVQHYRRKLLHKKTKSNTASPQSYHSSNRKDESPEDTYHRSRRNRRNSPPSPATSSRSGKATKRHRSRSLSPNSPTHSARSSSSNNNNSSALAYGSKLSRYADSPQIGLSTSSSSAHASYRSPSPPSYATSSSRSSKRDDLYASSRSSPTRSRSDRHKHRHKH